MARRKGKKQHRPDSLQRFESNLMGHVERAGASGKSILYVVGILVCLFIGFMFLAETSDRRNDVSSEALAKAEVVGDVEAYEKVAESYPGTSAGLRAMYFAALEHYRAASEFDATDERREKMMPMELCRKIIEQVPDDHLLSSLAHELLGQCYEQLPEYPKAYKIYDEAQAKNPDSFLGNKFLYHMAKMHNARNDRKGASTQARKALQDSLNASVSIPSPYGQDRPIQRGLEWRGRAQWLEIMASDNKLEGLPPLPKKKDEKQAPKSSPVRLVPQPAPKTGPLPAPKTPSTGKTGDANAPQPADGTAKPAPGDTKPADTKPAPDAPDAKPSGDNQN